MRSSQNDTDLQVTVQEKSEARPQSLFTQSATTSIQRGAECARQLQALRRNASVRLVLETLCKSLRHSFLIMVCHIGSYSKRSWKLY